MSGPHALYGLRFFSCSIWYKKNEKELDLITFNQSFNNQNFKMFMDSETKLKNLIST